MNKLSKPFLLNASEIEAIREIRIHEKTKLKVLEIFEFKNIVTINIEIQHAEIKKAELPNKVFVSSPILNLPFGHLLPISAAKGSLIARIKIGR